MELKILKIAIEKLDNDIQELKAENKQLREELAELKAAKQTEKKQIEEHANIKLLDTKEVCKFLNVCYNTLQVEIKKGLLTPIRLGQRRVKFTKQAVLEYIEKKKAIAAAKLSH